MKLSIIYTTDNEHLIICAHETVAGFHIMGEPTQRVSRREGTEKLGAAVLGVLNASTENVPMPADMKAMSAGVLKFSGVKSWKALAAKAVSSHVTFGPDGIVITPQLRDGQGGYSPLPGQNFEVPATAEAVGHGVLEALKHAS